MVASQKGEGIPREQAGLKPAPTLIAPPYAEAKEEIPRCARNDIGAVTLHLQHSP